MATTSPDNIRTPDPGDPYNLVPDLQTLAQDVQDALIARGNVFKGTAAQRVAFLSTASPGMLWQDTDGIGMLWKRGASQWVPAVWRWSGTTAQMNGFTQAPNGFKWYNTTTGTDHLRLGGAWVNQDTGWITPSLQGGWASSVSSPVAFRRIGAVVTFRGQAERNPVVTGVMFELTPDCTPLNSGIFPVSSASSDVGKLSVQATGDVSISAVPSGGTRTYVGLDSVSFMVG